MNKKALANFIGIGFSVLYFLTFFYIVFLARRRRHQAERYTNLVPFKGTLYHYHELAYTDRAHFYNFYSNLFGNIALFIPLSIVMLWLFRMQGKLKVILIAFLVSLSIETIQFALKIGYADVDDLILNTSGAAIGVLLYMIYEKISLRRNLTEAPSA